jgi:hypothetical protein
MRFYIGSPAPQRQSKSKKNRDRDRQLHYFKFLIEPNKHGTTLCPCSIPFLVVVGGGSSRGKLQIMKYQSLGVNCNHEKRMLGWISTDLGPNGFCMGPIFLICKIWALILVGYIPKS